MIRLSIAVITIAAVLLNGCGGVGPAVPDAPTAAIGVIEAVDKATGELIAVDAVAILGGVRGIITVAEGSVVLRDVPFGTATPPVQPLTVTAPGYRTYTTVMQLSQTDATFYTAELEAVDVNETGTMTGAVTSTAGGAIVSALVKFVHVGPGGATEVRGYTDNQGNYLVAGVPIGLNSATAEAAGYITTADQATVVQDGGGGQNAPLNFALLPGDTRVTVSGTVVDAFSNNPVAGATVELGAESPQVTNAAGAFSFPNVLVGTQTISVTATTYDPYEQDINVLPGMAPLRLALTPSAPEPPPGPYNLQGTVTLIGPPDSSGATVTAVNTTTSATAGQVVTPASGEYTMFLPPGEYRITASYGARSVSRTETIPGGGRILTGINFLLTVP
jgi:hypothetical protein